MRALVSILALIFTFSAHAGFEVQNGGGGVVSNGQYLTFQSANIPIQSQSLDIAHIPGLSMLIQKLQTLPLRSKTRARLTRLLMPTSDRAYFKADEGRMDANTRAALTKEYAKVMGIQEDRVVIFATTDHNSAQTVLFPEFFQLKEIEQAALLLHEGLWTLPGQRSYAEIVQVEMAAQANFENPSPNIYQQWAFLSPLVKMLDSVADLVPIAYQLQSEQLKKRSLEDLLGSEAWECLISQSGQFGDALKIDCGDAILNRMAILKIVEPTNLFADAMYSYVESNAPIKAINSRDNPTVRNYDKLYFNDLQFGQNGLFFLSVGEADGRNRLTLILFAN